MHQNRKLAYLVIAIFGSFLFNSCGTIFKGTEQFIPISSDPGDATIRLNGMIVGKTPIPLKLKKSQSHTLTLEKEGYQTETVIIDRNLSAMLVLDIFCIWPVSLPVDLIGGGGWELEPEVVMIRLQPIKTLDEQNVDPQSQRNHPSLAVVVEYSDHAEVAGYLSPAN